MTTISMWNQPVKLWTGPSRATRMMQAKALATRSGRAVLVHPGSKGVVGPSAHPDDDPWDRLHQILSRPDFREWPRDGWILTMDVTCPHCGETKLIEQQQTHRGLRVICAVCGKESPLEKPRELAR